MAYQLFQIPKALNISSTLTLLAGAKALFQLTGTSTNTPVYQDSGLTTPHTNPVVADAAGVFPTIYLNPEIRYRLTLKTSADVTLPGYPIDDVNDQLLSPAIIGTLLYPQSPAEIDNLVTPVNMTQPWGAIQRYGNNTVPGTTDMSSAIQNALKCNPRVWDNNTERSVFAISQTLYLTCDAQIFQGNGRGNVNEPGRTVLKWIGASGGTMLSVSDGVEHFQNCSVLDIEFDGNALANVGIEGYDDSVAGGCWRNKYRVSIRGVTQGTNSCGIYLGNGAFPDFAHDTEIHSSFITDPDRGVWGKGAKTRLINTTIRGCTDCGIRAEEGSSFADFGGVFSQNNRDIDGVDWRSISKFGGWFEDSVLGIFRRSGSGSIGFFGCDLHTAASNTDSIADAGNAAGHIVIHECPVLPGSGSSLIKNLNGDYTFDKTGSDVLGANGLDGYVPTGVRSSGQGRFFVGVTSDTAVVTGDGTPYSMDNVAVTERYDINNQVNATTGVFTAALNRPVKFTAQLALNGITANHTDATLEVVCSSGVNQLIWQGNLANLRTSANEAVIGGSTPPIPFVATQTANLRLTVNGVGGTKTVKVLSGGDATHWRTHFSGEYV